MKIRSFLAFELPLEVETVVTRVSDELRKSSLDAKWVKPENIHLTIVFMGDIEADKIPAIKEEIREACLIYDAFDISLKGLGCFPHTRKPRVIWIGLDGDLERMSSFRDALQECLIPFGIKEEKRGFKPHLTLGRFREPRRTNSEELELLSRYGNVTSPVCSLMQLCLFRSELKPGGARYTRLGVWPLLRRDDP
ncbi:MAG: RNA 2',3'-cyclic phosphodiesterase [Deltaproteobacteria bacterium]|nr:RNA 2',3'-cyclic phosphodiesterase [Deltaproteobacteria bacterium]